MAATAPSHRPGTSCPPRPRRCAPSAGSGPMSSSSVATPTWTTPPSRPPYSDVGSRPTASRWRFSPSRIGAVPRRGAPSAPPRLFYAVSAGNMDSMINHYTANKKRRNADAYSPGGAIGLRPDRACAVYAQRCREAGKGVPVVTGGVEASHAPSGALRLLVRQGASQQSRELQGGPAGLRNGGSGTSSRSRSVSMPESEPAAICATCAVSPICWAASKSLPDHRWEDTVGGRASSDRASELRGGAARTRAAFAEATRLRPPRDQSPQRPTSHPAPTASVPWS